MADIKKTYIKSSDGAKIYYEVSSGSPTLVYLHGTTVNHTVFDHQRAHFDEHGMGSISIDQRGDGKSTHFASPYRFTLYDYTEDLENVLAAEGIDKAVLVAHSMGSMVAQNFASKHPEMVDALVLISGSYDFTKSLVRSKEEGIVLKCAPLLHFALTGYNLAMGWNSVGRKFNYTNFSEDRFRDMDDLDFTAELYGKNNLEYVKSMQALSQAVMKWNTEHQAQQIQAPTLLIHGRKDPAVPVQTVHELHEMIETSKEPVIIHSGKHGIIFQQPEEVNDAIERFLYQELFRPRRL